MRPSLKQLMVVAVILGAAVVAGFASAGPEPAAAHPNTALLVIGDVQCDGDVDSVDALMILRYLAGLSVTQYGSCAASGDADIGSVIAYQDTSDNHRAYDLMGDVDLGGVPGNPAHCEGTADVDGEDADFILDYVAGIPPAACKAPATTGGGNYVSIQLGHNPHYYGSGTLLYFGFY